MSDAPLVLIANPHAGRGTAGRVVETAAATLRAAGREARGELTTSIHHATELAAQAAAAGQVAVAVGGDGLVRAVAAGASQHGGVVGIVPAGRGNDFARTVGIGKDTLAATRVLLDAEPRRTDCIAVLGSAPGDGARVAIGNVYMGFDSLTNVVANDLRVNLGQFSYTYAAVRVALTMPVHRFRVVVDGEAHEYDGSGVAICSSVFYGGAVPVAPTADPHDGLLDVVMFAQTTRRARFVTLLSMRKGGHIGRDGVQCVRGREVRVEVDPPLHAYSDGDPVAHTPLTATVMPGAIGLLRP